MSSGALTERILRFIGAKGYRPHRLQEMAEAMGVGADEQGDFHAACKALMKTGRIVLGSRQALVPPDPPGKIVGTYRGNERGFGFVIPDTLNAHGDLFIPRGQSGGAITGDTVVARVQKRGKRDGKMLYEGRIIEIPRRGRNRFVGGLRHDFGRWMVIPDGNTLHVPIMVGDPTAKNAKAGDQVVVRMTRYPSDEKQEARGVIVKVLGVRGSPGVATQSIIEQHQLPKEFSESILREADSVCESFDPEAELEIREDLTKLLTITIDPDDARDFDDAISLTKKRDGTMELGVHIADVSHFVREGTRLDTEAKKRSTSVYLPRHVIPMLPETLSNGVCSLQEKEPRVTKSVFITFTRRGVVKSARLANTIIKSDKRLTYRQAGAVLDGKKGRVSAKVVALLADMDRLAKAILSRRRREGMLELDLPEVELVYDDDGSVIGLQPTDTCFTHKIIEMFMVEANEAVARLLNATKAPFLRRIHDEPRNLASGELRKFLAALGQDLPKGAGRFELQTLLREASEGDSAFAVHLAVLKSMQQAEYSPISIGHYALAGKHYCHFTSPIRRYPDLTIHRLIKAYLQGEGKIPATLKGKARYEELVELGKLCSTNERRAEAAGREAKLVAVLGLLEDFLGEEMPGVVTGVANFGIFVQLDKFLVDGVLRFDQLPDDWWEVDPTRGSVVGQRRGQRITVGDRLQVVIAKINMPSRQMELALPGRDDQKKSGQRSKAEAPKRGRKGGAKRTGRKLEPAARGKKRRSRYRPPEGGRRG